MKSTAEINNLTARERDKIATVLYCHQFIFRAYDEPSMAAEMVHSQLAGYKLSTIMHIAKYERLNTKGWEIRKSFVKK